MSLEKSTTENIIKTLDISLFEQEIISEASNWTLVGWNYSDPDANIAWFEVLNSAGDIYQNPIQLRFDPTGLHERELGGAERGYQASLFVLVSDADGANECSLDARHAGARVRAAQCAPAPNER